MPWAVANSTSFVPETRGGRRAGGHVRVVDQHHLHAAQVALGQRLQVGQPAGGGGEVVFAHRGPADFGHRPVGGVAGIGNEHRVAGFQKGHAQVHQALFRAGQGQNFGGRVEGHAVVSFVKTGHRLAQRGRALVALVAVGAGLAGGGRQRRHHARVRRQIGAANAQADNIGPGRVEGGQLAQLAREVVFAGVGQAAGGGDGHLIGYR